MKTYYENRIIFPTTHQVRCRNLKAQTVRKPEKNQTKVHWFLHAPISYTLQYWFVLCYFGQVVILLIMYFISLCVLFSAYCIVLLSFVLAMLKWCIPALAIQSSYSFIWCLLFFTISCCGLINWINKWSTVDYTSVTSIMHCRHVVTFLFHDCDKLRVPSAAKRSVSGRCYHHVQSTNYSYRVGHVVGHCCCSLYAY